MTTALEKWAERLGTSLARNILRERLELFGREEHRASPGAAPRSPAPTDAARAAARLREQGVAARALPNGKVRADLAPGQAVNALRRKR